MRRWPSTRRIDVGIDFGDGPQPLGAAVGEGRAIEFQYDGAFVARGLQPSPIRLKLGTEPRTGPVELDGLPGMLFDSLPDGWSHIVLRRHLRAQGYDPDSLGPLDRLGLVRRDGPGALVFSGPETPITAPSVDFDTAAALISKAPDEEDADLVRMALTMAGSLGGARPKANVYLADGKFSTADSPGAEPWIVKFPAKNDGPQIGAVEFAYSLMARAAGIEMPPTTLLSSTETAGYFAVKRFDREDGGGRLHMHSLAGLLNVTANSDTGYRQLMLVTGALTQPRGANMASIEEQIRRMAFNVLARNRDDHVKNHAFLMNAQGEWRPSPAFDLTFCNSERHALMIANDRTEVGTDDLLEITRPLKFSDAEVTRMLERTAATIGEWPRFAQEAGVEPGLARDISTALGNEPAGSGGAGARMALRHSMGSGFGG